MLTLRRMRLKAGGTVVLLIALADVALRMWMPSGEDVRTIPTGASFNISVARSHSRAEAKAVAARLAASGLPTFTRILNHGRWNQVIVGPYLSIDEAEAAQRTLAARGFGARMLVDESVRREPGSNEVPVVSPDMNVVLVAAAGRLSLVLEMSAEPRTVHARRVEPTLLEVEAGPVTAPVAWRRWHAPEGVDLIHQVTLEDVASAGQRSVRTRIVLSESTQSNVRVVGRRLYVDLWSPEPPYSAGRPHTEHAGAALVAARQVAGQQAVPTAGEMPDYGETIRPAVARLKAMEPFVMSAAASPAPDVLVALTGSLRGLQQWIQTIEAPGDMTMVHGALITGVELAIRSVDPEFHGDRGAQAREAFGLLNLQSTLLPPPSPEARP